MSGAAITLWHGANAKNQSLLRCLDKKFFSAAERPTEQSELLSYLFETSFKNALKNLESCAVCGLTPTHTPLGVPQLKKVWTTLNYWKLWVQFSI